MTFQNEIIEELKQKLKNSSDARNAILDQIKLKDISIDKMDVLISNIDKKIPQLLQNINTKISALEAAYDARISAGCRSDLRWQITETKTNQRDSSSYTVYTCIRNNTREQKNFYGQKYYRKPLNRDFGSNLITELIGNISSGSTVLSIVGSGGTTAGSISDVVVGDTVTDNITSPTIFTIGQLPEVVSFGTTSVVGFTTTLGGNIGLGSDRFVNVGFGTTAAVTIGSAVSFTGILPVGTTVTGIGTADSVTSFYNPITGLTSSVTVTSPALILSNVSLAATESGTLYVGVTTTVPTLILDKVANQDSSNNLFSIIRTTSDIDSDFDFTKSPLNPVTVGILGSQSGIGHTTLIVNNGSPSGPVQWKQQQNDPEPSIGAGFVDYYRGNTFWPVLTVGAGFGLPGAATSYASLGQVFVSSSSTLTSNTSNATITTISPTGAVDGVNNGSANCADLDASITAAENALTQAINDNLPELQRLNSLASTLREVRDKNELEAYGMLQGSAFQKSEVNKLQDQIDAISGSDLSDFEP